jgi:hypothetical protein
MDHSAMEHREPATKHHDSAPPPERSSPSETPDWSVPVRRLDPSATLGEDGLDAAAPGSAAEAEKAVGGQP